MGPIDHLINRGMVACNDGPFRMDDAIGKIFYIKKSLVYGFTTQWRICY
jgi:hypothetical protein